MFKIGKRSLKTFAKRLIKFENYIALINFFKVHKTPIKSILEELFSTGSYPKTIFFNSPIGSLSIELFSPNDLSTFNLVFCREDYLFEKKHRIILDIGSNIGISALYWLTRNQNTFVYCYEPATENLKRLKKNLDKFKGRYTVYNKAISNKSFSTFLNLEKSGVYNSLTSNDEVNFKKKEKCVVEDINFCIEQIINDHGKIDIIKVDNEGEELKTISAIKESFWSQINCLNVDGKMVRKYVPNNFHYSAVGSAQRYLKK